MSLSALQRLVNGAGSEASEKNAIVKHLAKNGHRRMPSTSTSRNGRTVVRAYLWRDTPLGNIALVAGPSVKGRVYLVEPVNRDVHEDEIDVYLPPSAGRPAYVSFKRNSARRRQERAQAAASRGHTPWGYDYNYRNNPEQHEGMVKVPLRRAVLYVPAEDIEGLDAPIDVTEVPVEPPARAPAPPRVTPPAPPRVTAPVTRSRLSYPQTIEPTYAGVMSFLQCNADQAYTISEIDELTGHSGRDRRSSPTAGMLKGLARVSYNPLVENVNKGTTQPARYKATVDYEAATFAFGVPSVPDLVRSVLKFAGASPSGFLELNSLICMGDSDTRDEITEAVVNTLDRSAPQAAYNTLLTTIDSAFAAGTFGLARLLQTIGFERYPSQFVMWVPLSLLGKGRKALNAPVSIQWGNGAQKYTLYGRIVGSSHSAPGLGYTPAQLKAQAKLQNGNTKGKLVLIQGIGERPAVPDVPPEIVPPAPVVVKPIAPKPTPVVTRPAPPKPTTTPASRAKIQELKAVIDAVSRTGDEDAAYTAIEAAEQRVVNAVHLTLTGKGKTGEAAREGLNTYVVTEYNAWQDQQEPEVEPEPEPVIIPPVSAPAPVAAPPPPKPMSARERIRARMEAKAAEKRAAKERAEREAASAPAPAPTPSVSEEFDEEEVLRKIAERKAARAAKRAAAAAAQGQQASGGTRGLSLAEKLRRAASRKNPGYRGGYSRRNPALSPTLYSALRGDMIDSGLSASQADELMAALVEGIADLSMEDVGGADGLLDKVDTFVDIYRADQGEDVAVIEPEPSISPEEADRVIRKIMAEEAAKMKKEAQSATQRPAQKRPAQKRRRDLPAGPPSSIPQTPKPTTARERIRARMEAKAAEKRAAQEGN